MSQGPIGAVVVRLPDWEFLEQKSFTKDWSKKLDDTSLLKIPIPDLGVRVDLSASASANAAFVASLGPGKLRNIRLGLTKTQAALLAAGALMGGAIEEMELLYLLPKLAVLGFDDLRALADLEIPASVSLHLGAIGTLKAAAMAAGLFEVAMIAASLEATASADLPVKLGGPVGLYLENGKLDFKYHQSLDAQLNLAFSLVASLQAKLLGFQWSKSWNLASANLGHTWKLGTVANVGYDGGPKADMAMNEDNKDGALPGWLTDILNAAQSAQQLQSLMQPGGGAPGGPGGAGPNAAASAPGGRSESDPIDMVWFKSPGLYPTSVTLGSERVFFTEPDYVVVPDQPGLADIRRDADTAGRIRVGVSPNSKFYPRVGNVWPRVRVGQVRGGTKQAQFRRLLQALGYNWGSMEADHVRDLQWRGEDAYANLWPLEGTHNGAANDILSQMVTYKNAAGVVQTVPLSQTPLNLYFRIIAFSGSASHAVAGGGAAGGGIPTPQPSPHTVPGQP